MARVSNLSSLLRVSSLGKVAWERGGTGRGGAVLGAMCVRGCGCAVSQRGSQSGFREWKMCSIGLGGGRPLVTTIKSQFLREACKACKVIRAESARTEIKRGKHWKLKSADKDEKLSLTGQRQAQICKVSVLGQLQTHV